MGSGSSTLVQTHLASSTLSENRPYESTSTGEETESNGSHGSRRGSRCSSESASFGTRRNSRSNSYGGLLFAAPVRPNFLAVPCAESDPFADFKIINQIGK